MKGASSLCIEDVLSAGGRSRNSTPLALCGAVLVLLCVALMGYSTMGVVRDVWLVNKTFPTLPSYFATDMQTAILVSPLMLCRDDFGDSFLHRIKYPRLALPNAPLPPAIRWAMKSLKHKESKVCCARAARFR